MGQNNRSLRPYAFNRNIELDKGKSSEQLFWEQKEKATLSKLLNDEEKPTKLPSEIKSVMMFTFSKVQNADAMGKYKEIFQRYISENIEHKCIINDLNNAMEGYIEKYSKSRGIEIK